MNMPTEEELTKLWDPTLGPCGLRALNVMRAVIAAAQPVVNQSLTTVAAQAEPSEAVAELLRGGTGLFGYANITKPLPAADKLKPGTYKLFVSAALAPQASREPSDPMEGLRGMPHDLAKSLIHECIEQAGVKMDKSKDPGTALNVCHRIADAAYRAGASNMKAIRDRAALAQPIEDVRMAYKTGYDEGYSDAGDGVADHDACEEGWQQYRAALGGREEAAPEASDRSKLGNVEYDKVVARDLDKIMGASPPPAPAEASEPVAITEWRDARRASIAATEAYNAALVAARKQDESKGFGFTDVNAEYQAMNEATNRAHKLREPALDALFTFRASPPPAPPTAAEPDPK
jgi:hypothetical protein